MLAHAEVKRCMGFCFDTYKFLVYNLATVLLQKTCIILEGFMSLNELKRMFEERSQSWYERHKQLVSENRWGFMVIGGEYPRAIISLDSSEDEFVFKAQEITGAPVALSEERYPNDMSNGRSSLSVLYQVAECPDPKHCLSEFWAVFDHLAGRRRHKCGAYCAKHELFEFVIGEK